MRVVITVKVSLDTAHNDPERAVTEAVVTIKEMLPTDGVEHLVTSVRPLAKGFGKVA